MGKQSAHNKRWHVKIQFTIQENDCTKVAPTKNTTPNYRVLTERKGSANFAMSHFNECFFVCLINILICCCLFFHFFCFVFFFLFFCYWFHFFIHKYLMPFLYKLPTSMPTQLLLNTIHSCCCLCITEIEKKTEIHTALPAAIVVVVVAVAPV